MKMVRPRESTAETQPQLQPALLRLSAIISVYPLAPSGAVAEHGACAHTTMKVEGLKGCFEKTRGVFYFARMCSKIRLHAQGKLPMDYHEGLGQGFDGRTCRYFGVRYEDVRAQVLSGKTDAEVLDWCFANGRRLTEEEILIYNSFISKRGWHDDESDGFLAQMIKKLGLRDDGSVFTYFDLIEMDEGRWYPDMWRDAWK
jgi:hypothetical protein